MLFASFPHLRTENWVDKNSKPILFFFDSYRNQLLVPSLPLRHALWKWPQGWRNAFGGNSQRMWLEALKDLTNYPNVISWQHFKQNLLRFDTILGILAWNSSLSSFAKTSKQEIPGIWRALAPKPPSPRIACHHASRQLREIKYMWSDRVSKTFKLLGFLGISRWW